LFTIEHHVALEARIKIRASRKNEGKEAFGRQFVLAALGTATLAACNFPLVAMGNPVARPATAPPAGSQLPPISTIAKPESYKSEIPLYPSQTAHGPDEQWESYLGGPIVRNVINPTLTPLPPEPEKATRTAVIYAPGGGFKYLGMSNPETDALRAEGVRVFVLKYRTETTDRDPKTFLTNLYKWLFDMAAKNQLPGASEAKPLHAPKEALEDGLAAVRLVRSRAKEWGIDPERIGFMGGSAGAMTAIDVAFTKDDQARPDFIVTLIGPKKIDDVPATAPPLFAAASSDDPLFPGATEDLVAAWSKANRPVEAHFFERGGHGIGKGTTGERWLEGLIAWMKMHGWLDAAK
jgi:acetyl esterase/lipase